MPHPNLISADRAFDLLEALERDPACVPALLTHTPVTGAELATMPPEDQARRSAAAIAGIQPTPKWRPARDVIVTLGRCRFEPAVALLARIWRHSVLVPLRAAAGHALFQIGSSDAHAALQAALFDAEPPGHLPTFLALKSILATAPDAAYDRLEPLFQGDADARRVAGEALGFFGPAALGRDGRTWHLALLPDLLRNDRRWIRTAVRLRRDPLLGHQARSLLSSLTPDELDAALVETPDPPASPAPSYAGPRDLLVRYERGEIGAVWSWLRGAGSVVDDASLRAEARAVAEAAMNRVRRNVELVTQRLRAWDYPFDGEPWTPPSARQADDITRIEHAIRGPVPMTLRAFWMAVGRVCWALSEDDGVDDVWRGLALREADPLWVDDAATAWWSIEAWEEEVADSHIEIVGPAHLTLAPDYLHKANISGGAPYGFSIPNPEFDAVFEHEAHALPFVEYLRLCFRWGGFPRLSSATLDAEGRRTLDALRQNLEPF